MEQQRKEAAKIRKMLATVKGDRGQIKVFPFFISLYLVSFKAQNTLVIFCVRTKTERYNSFTMDIMLYLCQNAMKI